MCTAVKFRNIHGRNLDLEYPLNMNIVVCPRKYQFKLRHEKETLKNEWALIGMGMIKNNYPLYFEAMNEKGLFIGGLNFNGYAKYSDINKSKNIKNICSFELIPFLLKKCKNVDEVIKELKNVNITKTAFSKNLIPSPLHWQVSDKKKTIVIEQTEKGLNIYDNPLGVLTNNPEFPYHLENFKKYTNMFSTTQKEIKIGNYKYQPISNGSNTNCLPGGLSSQDRFIKVAYTALNSVCDDTEENNVNQFFHILNSVHQTKGQVISMHDNSLYEITLYSCAISADSLTYYYKTYDNSQINAISLKSKNINLNDNQLIIYKLENKQNINKQN